MKKFILLLLLGTIVISCENAFGQKKATLTIYDINRSKNRDELIIHYEIVNGDSMMTFYKLDQNDFCNGLAALNVIDGKSGKEGFYFPCIALAHLDNIILSNSNSFILQPQQKYRSFFTVKRKHLSIVLKKRSRYTFFMSFNYDNLQSSSETNYYKEKLISNKIDFIR